MSAPDTSSRAPHGDEQTGRPPEPPSSAEAPHNRADGTKRPLWDLVWQWLFAQGGPLKQRVLRGGIWLVGGAVATRAARLLKIAILARLLSPADFGLLGIAMLMVAWLEYFSETGFKAALIQRRGDIRPYLDTSFTIQLLRSMALAVAVVLSAPLGAWYFERPDAAEIIRAVAVVVLLRGLTNPAVVYLGRKLDFYRQVVLNLSAVFASLLVAIPLAFLYRSVWALVLALIAAQAVETIGSYWVRPYRPRFHLEWARARELIEFGRWIFFLNVLSFFNRSIDSLFVAKILGATALGFYQIAHDLALVPTVKLGEPVRKVMFPAFSRLQDTADLRRVFLRTLTLIGSVALPVGCFTAVFAEPLVIIILGERWLPIVPAVRIMVWAGVAQAVTGLMIPLLKAVGKPALVVPGQVLRVVVLAVLIYPLATMLGITGAALALTSSTLLAMTYQWVLIGRLIRPSSRELGRALKVGALGAAPFLAASVLVSGAVTPSLFVVVGVATALSLMVLVRALPALFGVRISSWLAREQRTPWGQDGDGAVERPAAPRSRFQLHDDQEEGAPWSSDARRP